MQKDFSDSKTKSLSVNDTMNEYFAAVFKIGIILEMSAALSAAIAFTAMKAFGLYPTVKWIPLLAFDIMDIFFWLFGFHIVRNSYDERNRLKPGRLEFGKRFAAIVMIIQWNCITYLIPSKMFWGFMFFFLMLLAYMLDMKLVIKTAAVIFISQIISWILKKDLFLPETKEFFIAEMILRVLAIIMTIADMAILLYFITKFLVTPIGNFASSISKIISSISESEKILQETGSELQKATGETTTSISEIFKSIDGVSAQIAKVNGGVEQTDGIVRAIIGRIDGLDEMIQAHGESVSMASAAVEQMIGNIDSVESSVEKMATAFGCLLDDSKNGTARQEAVNERIKEIESQSNMLQEANQAIENIASQTNLLAMNAAIEAAHAGEAGKGFSVVADEIRKLSETSTSQSKVIGDQLKKIKDSIGGVVLDSAQSKLAFESLAKRIEETNHFVQQIKFAMDEQQEGSKQIDESLHSMNDSTLEVRDATTEMNKESQTIIDEIIGLRENSSQMTQKVSEITRSANNIKRTGDELSEIVDSVNDAMEKIGEHVRQFS